MLAAQFPLELGDRVSARIGAQASQPLGVARTGVLRRDRLRLRLLRRRHLGSVIDRRSGWLRGSVVAMLSNRRCTWAFSRSQESSR